MIKKIYILFFFCTLFAINSEENLLDTIDLDSLFEEEISATDGSSNSSESTSTTTEEPINLLEEINKKGFTFGAKYQLFLGYTTGDDKEDELIEYPVMGLNSSFTLNSQLSNDFRVYQKWNMNYPDFEISLSQIYGEVTVLNSAYVKFGMFSPSWGESNFKFTNLTGRVPEDVTSGDTYSIQTSIPIGIGGLSLVAVTKEGFWSEAEEGESDYTENAPEVDEIGLGIKYNHILNIMDHNIDLNMGYYYYKDLNLRGFISLNTTIFKNYEFFAEGLVSYNPTETTYINDNPELDMDNYNNLNQEPDFFDNYLDISFALGIYTDYFDEILEIGTEYYYNGEETEIDSVKGYHGHNILFKITGNFDILKSEISGNLVMNYDEDIWSGVFTPVYIWDITDDLMLSITSPLYFGDEDSNYINDVKDPNDREFALTVRLIFHGDI